MPPSPCNSSHSHCFPQLLFPIPSLCHSAQQHASPCQAIAQQLCTPPFLDKARRFIPLPLQAFSFPERCKPFLFLGPSNRRLSIPFLSISIHFRSVFLPHISTAALYRSNPSLRQFLRWLCRFNAILYNANPTRFFALPSHIHSCYSLMVSGSWPSADGTRYRLLCLPSASDRAPVPRPAS